MEGYLYFALCGNDKYYVGSCIDLESRITDHNRGNTKSTKNIRPVKLVFSQKFQTLMAARKAERWIKQQKNRKLVERVISEGTLNKTFD